VEPAAVGETFEAITPRIQKRHACDRVRVLQRRLDEYPERYADYRRAFGDHGSLSR
jgi:hypothetical protein